MHGDQFEKEPVETRNERGLGRVVVERQGQFRSFCSRAHDQLADRPWIGTHLVSPSQPYLVGRNPGDVIRLKFHTELGSASLFYQRSKKYGLGIVYCWVDDDEETGVYMDGYWNKDQSVPQSSLISDKLEPGDHVLSCKIHTDTKDPGGGHEFRITTLIA